MQIKKEVLDQLMDYQKPEDLIGEAGLLKQLTKALLEWAMNAELDAASGVREARFRRDTTAEFRLTGRLPRQSRAISARWQGDAARPQRQLRAADPAEAPDAVPRLRRQDAVDAEGTQRCTRAA
jgi:hypothetical protein